ncbi:major facilitator superfamily domain-containing protein 6-like isoform X2 [Macrobrachium rosenbergii]|uniref:major facilitator superfamily domain-containing protein 6-like isoform X2 n=1 Tax=Macrobrachium rosenbergii TaxID=79674 RepID=UPI0034D6CDE7
MNINRSLLPIKLHYFLRYAGAAFLATVLPLIVRQKGVSPQGIGFLWSTMPIVGLISNSVSGAFADYFRAHRAVFLCSLAVLTTGLLAAYGLPSLPLEKENTSNALQDISAQFPILPPGEENNGNVLRNISAQFTNFSAAEELYNRDGLTYPEQTKGSSAFNGTSLQFPSATDHHKDVKDPELTTEEGQFPPPVSKDSTGGADSPVDSLALSHLMKYPQFWLIFGALMMKQMGTSTCVMITDAVCLQILGDKRHKYGQQRLWGTIGKGTISVITGALVDLYSKGLPQADYLPAAIICAVIMTSDMVLVSRMTISSSQGRKVKMRDVGSVIIHPQAVLFFVTAFVVGTSTGLLSVFKLMYMEDVSNAWDPTFSNLKFLQGLSISIEAFGGDVPFFFVSGMIIKRLGYKVVFAGCLGTLAIRFCIYYTITNPWWFLPVEFLSGITFALFHSCMAAYASHLAPPGAQASLQAVVRAVSLIGGSGHDSSGTPLATSGGESSKNHQASGEDSSSKDHQNEKDGKEGKETGRFLQEDVQCEK